MKAWAFAIVLLAACGDDDAKLTQAVVTRTYDAFVGSAGDVSLGDASAGDATTTTTDGTSTTMVVDSLQPDAPQPDATDPEVVELACDREGRLAACDDPLLDHATPPTDGADPLFYVNRDFAIPASYPVSATSTWTPCSGGSAPGGVPNDLLCLPTAYSTQSTSLRQLAWESPAPVGMTLTSDGKTVGHDGKVGFKAAMDAALEEGAGELFGSSCFRPYARQEAVFDSYVEDEMSGGVPEEEATIVASTYSAHPGHSEHQLGTTCDLVYRKPNGSVSSFGTASAVELANSSQFRWLRDNGHRFGLVLTYGHDRVEITHYVWEPWHWRFVGVAAADVMHRCGLDTEELLNARYDAGALEPYAGDELILYDDVRVVAGDSGTITLDPNESFQRSFTVENTGTKQLWNELVAHVSGEDFGGGDEPLACTPPQAQTTFTLDLQAPATPGTYTGRWQLLSAEGTQTVDATFDVRVFVRGGTSTGDPYRFVRIDDLSNSTSSSDPGVDLDAIVLTDASGLNPTFATAVAYYHAAPGSVGSDDPSDALGAPDAFSAWPSVTTCGVASGFVSLGGAGTLIVEMARPIVEGDHLQVLEVGACSYGSGTAIADPYRVSVAVDGGAAADGEPVGDASGGPKTLTVPFLPPR